MNAKGRCGLRFFAALLTGILATGVTAWGAPASAPETAPGTEGKAVPAPTPGAAADTAGKPAPDAAPDKKAPADARYEKHWMFSMGGSNYYPRLKESEAQINSQINGTLGRVIPGWRRPQTFKAWRDNMLLWDLCFGAGRDISPRFSWMAWTGGATGTIVNKHGYGPIHTDIRFKRTTGFLTLQGYFYPLGKPDASAGGGETLLGKITSPFVHAKPYLSLATGYSFVQAEAKVKLDLFSARVFKQTQLENHHMGQVSPRLGVEMPISKHSSATAEAVYYHFFPAHSDEYSGPSLCFVYKYKF